MPNKEFLENYSLFRKMKINLPDYFHNLEKPTINMKCLKCELIQTFKMEKSYFRQSHINIAGVKKSIIYTCQSCNMFTREFQVYFSSEKDYVYKYGQYPEWEIKIEKNLEKNLGKYSSNFRKGLVCESQGYGIGAFSYYRRIVEDIIDELLDSIKDLIDEKEKEIYVKALEKTKETTITQEKIKLVKHLLPSNLKIKGVNPLGLLHEQLSLGLHKKTDETCLDDANLLRIIMTFLINQVNQSRETKTFFNDSMKSLLKKKIEKAK